MALGQFHFRASDGDRMEITPRTSDGDHTRLELVMEITPG